MLYTDGMVLHDSNALQLLLVLRVSFIRVAMLDRNFNWNQCTLHHMWFSVKASDQHPAVAAYQLLAELDLHYVTRLGIRLSYP